MRSDLLEGDASSKHHGAPDSDSLVLVLSGICLLWYIFMLLVSSLGCAQIWLHYSSTPPRSRTESAADCPAVTVIRPVKGLDPNLYECLAATFRQSYPTSKLTIYLCIASRTDPALPILERVLRDFADHDAHLLVADEDSADASCHGPNPKIRNMSQAYRSAKSDIIWVIDCNAWVAKGACGRMVDTLEGHNSTHTPYKFVHHLPLVVSTDTTSIARHGGCILEESFMSSAHAKFYTAINTVSVAPCTLGKSNMFRKSHLDSLTEGQGIDYFSHNICEDHLIGDLLWKRQVSQELVDGEVWGKHALVRGDLAIQPVAGMSVADYVARRTRWLRVRKWTVPLATLVEPGTESFVCSLLGAVGVANLMTDNKLLGVCFWLLSVSAWCLADWLLYRKLHSGASIDVDDRFVPAFVHVSTTRRRRSFPSWFLGWVCREALAFPVWVRAVFGGGTVVWRGKRLWVGFDGKVQECESARSGSSDEHDQTTREHSD